MQREFREYREYREYSGKCGVKPNESNDTEWKGIGAEIRAEPTKLVTGKGKANGATVETEGESLSGEPSVSTVTVL